MELLAVIIFIFGVLQIILFFKLWGMTNDVRALKKHFMPEEKNEKPKYAYNLGSKVFVNSLSKEAIISKKDGDKVEVKLYGGSVAETYLSDLTPAE